MLLADAHFVDEASSRLMLAPCLPVLQRSTASARPSLHSLPDGMLKPFFKIILLKPQGELSLSVFVKQQKNSKGNQGRFNVALVNQRIFLK
jgi:hypothetical protein